MEQNNDYLKYIKYKKKYLLLKNHDKISKISDSIGGLGWSDIVNITTDVGINIMVANLPFKYKKIYSDMVNSGLLTKENKEIIFQILKNGLKHLTDPNFYSIMFKIFECMSILAGSVETLTIPLIIESLQGLYIALEQLKKLYPEDFILIKKFLLLNREKIFKMIEKYGYGNSTVNKLYYDIFVNLISI